jgi:hypothetical protein
MNLESLKYKNFKMEVVPSSPTLKSGKRTYDIVVSTKVAVPKYTGVAVKARRARQATVYSNHYDLVFPKDQPIYQWNATFAPELPEDSRGVIDSIFQANMRDIITTMGKFIRAANCLFTFVLPVDKEDVKLFTFGKHPDFKVTLKRQKDLNFSQIFAMDIKKAEVMRVINFQVKQMMKSLKYLEFGIDRKYFAPKNTVQEEVMRGDFILNIMKGFGLLWMSTRVVQSYKSIAAAKLSESTICGRRSSGTSHKAWICKLCWTSLW